MNCTSFRDRVTDLIVPGAAGEAAEMAEHAARCPACATYLAEMQAALGALRPSCEIKASANFKERVMKKMRENEEQAEIVKLQSNRPRRVLPWWQAAAAAALLIAGYLAFTSLSKHDAGSAWAVEKTMAAYEGLKFIHIKIEPVTPEHAAEMWAQFDGKGKLELLRFDFAETADGPKVVVWQQDKAQVWFKKKNVVVVVKEPKILKGMKMSVNDFDPRAIVGGAFKPLATKTQGSKGGKFYVSSYFPDQAAGTPQTSVTPSETQDSKKGKAYMTSVLPNQTAGTPQTSVTPWEIWIVNPVTPDMSEIFHIDPKTNLVTSIEKIKTTGGKGELLNRFTYLDYNDPKVAEAFKPAIPADAMRVDETAQTIGLRKGTLTDQTVAIQVVREFFEALIAKDYAKAGRLYGGIPAATLEKAYGPMRVIRIISIGTPVPYKANNSLKVPCKVEIEKDGKKDVWEPYGPFVRQVYNQPERWEICGGI